jgi:Flp pilus assembly protein TadD
VAALKEEAGELEQRGRFHSQIGMFTKAEQLYRRAEALDPTNPEICGGLGLIAAARGETQSALLQLAASIELGTGDPAVFQAFQGLTPPSA